MIKCDKGIVEIVGNGPRTFSELSLLVHALYREYLMENCGMDQETARKMILEAVERGMEIEEELKDGAKGDTNEIAKAVANALEELINALNGKDEE